jgi:hypothetical protein
LIVVAQPVVLGNENQLGRFQSIRHGERDTVGVGPVRLAVTVKS